MGAGRQVDDGDAGLADQFLRLVILVDTAEDGALRAGAVVQGELQQLLGLLDRLAGEHLYSAEIGLRERFKVNEIGKQRLDLYIGKVDLSSGSGAA